MWYNQEYLNLIRKLGRFKMKKFLTTLAVITLCILTLTGCKGGDGSVVELNPGLYKLEGSENKDSPYYIEILKNDEFMFNYSEITSHVPYGKYSLEGNILTLNDTVTGNKFVFEVSDRTLIFRKDQSGQAIVYEEGTELADGAKFVFSQGDLL